MDFYYEMTCMHSVVHGPGCLKTNTVDALYKCIHALTLACLKCIKEIPMTVSTQSFNVG